MWLGYGTDVPQVQAECAISQLQPMHGSSERASECEMRVQKTWLKSAKKIIEFRDLMARASWVRRGQPKTPLSSLSNGYLLDCTQSGSCLTLA